MTIGTAVHHCIAELASCELPDLEAVCSAAGRAARHASGTLGARVGTWQVASLAGVAIRMRPPPDWRLLGVEVPVRDGAMDVVWLSPHGVVLADEYKHAGFGRVLEDADLVAQVGRYRRWGSLAHREQFAGVRVLALAGPLRSRFWPPTGPSVPLPGSEFWFGFGEQLNRPRLPVVSPERTWARAQPCRPDWPPLSS